MLSFVAFAVHALSVHTFSHLAALHLSELTGLAEALLAVAVAMGLLHLVDAEDLLLGEELTVLVVVFLLE